MRSPGSASTSRANSSEAKARLLPPQEIANLSFEAACQIAGGSSGRSRTPLAP